MKNQQSKLVIFQNKKIRRVWHKKEWFFSVVDIVAILTESLNPTDYLKKIRKRDAELKSYIGTNCPQVEMLTDTNKKRKILAGKARKETEKEIGRSVISNGNYLSKKKKFVGKN